MFTLKFPLIEKKTNDWWFCSLTLNMKVNELRLSIPSQLKADSVLVDDYRIKRKTTVIWGTSSPFLQLSCPKYFIFRSSEFGSSSFDISALVYCGSFSGYFKSVAKLAQNSPTKIILLILIRYISNWRGLKMHELGLQSICFVWKIFAVIEAYRIADWSSYNLSIFFDYTSCSLNDNYSTAFSQVKFPPLISAKTSYKY